jgi:ATP-dependent Lon protease
MTESSRADAGGLLGLPPDALRWRCPADALPFESTLEVEPSDAIIGQARAVEAISFGLDMPGGGHNLFITGHAGTGRNVSIRRLLEGLRRQRPTPPDLVLVHNFRRADTPVVLSLPAGVGTTFVGDLDGLVQELRKEIPRLLGSEVIVRKKRRVAEAAKEATVGVLKALEKRAEEEGFALVQVQMGPFTRPDLVPVVDGKPVSLEEMEANLAKEGGDRKAVEALKSKYEDLSAELHGILHRMRLVDRTIRKDVRALERGAVETLVRESVTELKDRYAGEKTFAYLDALLEDVLEHVAWFKGRGDEDDGEEDASADKGAPTKGDEEEGDGERRAPKDPFGRYRANLLVDHSNEFGAPVVAEQHPSYRNLFGGIERAFDRRGFFASDLRGIKAGSLLQSSGGFLLLNALDVLLETGVWPALKRTLRSRRLEIQNPDFPFLFASTSLKPEPIEVDLKVVLIGSYEVYQLLYFQDPEFAKIFKVRADFDSEMPLDHAAIASYVGFVRRLQDEEKLLPFERSAVEAIVEHGVRLAGSKRKLSTHFQPLCDLVVESAQLAKGRGAERVGGEDVERVLEARRRHRNLLEEKIQERIGEGYLLVSTEGGAVGRVNGLSVLDTGDYAFGRPSRITATVSPGRAGVVNIERESALSGRIHDKGVLILAGHLRGLFARERPLALSASLCFEQSYSGVEGDSASSTEVYAILSALADLPIRQDLAVTGSLNQQGEIQPIGGVNEKIEGFFDVCRARGLTGTQGVLVPVQNVADLMLRKDVVRAVEEGRFHVFAVRTIDEGISLLTGVPAGERLPRGGFTPGSVYDRADRKLAEFARILREWEGHAAGA